MMLKSTNPAKGYEVLGEIPVSSSGEIAAKVAAARAAQRGWWDLGVSGRVAALKKLEKIFLENRAELVRRTSLEMGMPSWLSNGIADSAEGSFAWDLENAGCALEDTVLFDDGEEVNLRVREPYGVMACIVAWNFPYPNFIVSAVPALLAGNCVVMKYSEEIPLFSRFMEDLIAQAGLPDGVMNFVYGDGKTGATLADQDIDLISFTGSSAVGQSLYKKAAEKFIPIIMELGGSSPGIVFPDCPLDEIVEPVFGARFANTAQFCNGLKRLIVHESCFDAFAGKLAAYANTKIIGDPADEATELGPLVAKRQVVKLEEQLQDAIDKGAKVLCGGRRPSGLSGAYFEPTLLTDVTFDMRVWREEVFGPVLPIVPFKTYEEALALANDTVYGLSGYIYTTDKELERRAARDLRAGSIDGKGAHLFRPQNPFGGYKHSGIGRSSGFEGFEDVTQIKMIAYRK